MSSPSLSSPDKSSEDDFEGQGSVVTGRLFGYAKPFLGLIGIGVVSTLGARGLLLLLPQLASRIIDATTAQLDPAALSNTGALILGVVLGLAVLQFVGNLLFSYVGEKVVLRLRYDIFGHLLSLSLDFFERRRVGELISRVAADAAQVREIGTRIPLEVISRTVTVVGAVTIVAIQSPQLTLTLFAFIPLVVINTAVFGRIVRRRALENRDNLAQTNVVLEESLSGIETVKSFAQEAGELGQYETRLSEVFRSSMRVVIARAFMRLLSLFIIYGGLAVVTWYATTLILTGTLTAGELVEFLMYALLAGNSFAALTAAWASWERLRGVSLRLVQILETGPSVVDHPQAGSFDGSHQVIEFRDVAFSYPTDRDRPVLDDLNFSFKCGQHVALVGESGAGKSTVAALLLRLYDVTAGSIAIDGLDIRALRQKDLREAIAVVPQDVVVFGRSVHENITYGKRDATDAEVRAAAEAAHALEFIEGMPQRFETILGERGVTISGGQRQRIAIARAILKNPSILILDEATSSLDKPSETLVRDALKNLMKGRTTFVIAHRLATIEHSDRVLVLHEGRLVESGSHSELLSANGHYARLYRMGAWGEGQVA